MKYFIELKFERYVACNIDMKIRSYKKIIKLYVFTGFFLSIYENFFLLDFVLIKTFF